MPNIGGRIFGTPWRAALHVPAPGPQKFAIASAHERKAGLYEADCSAAQIMRFPGAIGDALFAEQEFRDCVVSAAGCVRLERTDGGA